MFTVYILRSSKIPRTYVGYSGNLEQGLDDHNAGKVAATKPYRPWEIFYKEINLTLKDAKTRELYWKSGAGRRNLKRLIGGFPPHFR